MSISNTSIEFAAIHYLMEKKKPELLVAITPELFGNSELAKIFLLIRRFYMEHSVFPGWDLLAGKVSSSCKTPEKTKFITSILTQIKGRDDAGLTDDLLLQELRDYYKFRLVLSKAEPLIASVEAKNISDTLTQLKSLYDSVFIDAEYRLEDADMASMAGSKVKFDFRSTGLSKIDERGGLIKGGLTYVAAPAKAGKSTLCSMMLLNQYLHEEGSVAYFSWEMGADEVRSRILSNHSDVDLGAIMSDNMSELERLKLRTSEAVFYCGEGEGKDIIDFCKVNQSIPREEFFPMLFDHFPKRENKFYIFDERLDFDDLFIKMELLATTKGVKAFVVDYLTLVPRGRQDSQLAQWEYILLQSKKLKTFSHKHKLNVISPAQLDAGKKGEDPKIRFASNIINDCDLCLFLVEDDEDKTLGTVTIKWGAMRNFKTVVGKPFLEPFKLLKDLSKSRFSYVEF